MQFLKIHLNSSKYDPSILVALAMFCLTLGASIKGIGIGLALGTIVLMPQYRSDIFFIFRQPITWIILAFCGVAALGCFWSEANVHQKLYVFEKYCKFICIPLFAAGFAHKKSRFYGIHAYLLGMLIVCLVSMYRLWLTDLSSLPVFDPGKVFYDHIITGYMMAFAAYLAAYCSTNARSLQFKWGYLILTLLFSIQIIFVNTGRTGYFVYAILCGLFLIQNFSVKHIRYSVLGSILGFFCLLPFLSTGHLVHGIHAIQDDLHNYQLGQKNTSVGIRIQFHQYAKSLFLTKPILGYGTGGFSAQFTKDKPIPIWENNMPNPHSQYWLIASEFGLVGLSIYLFILLILSKMSFELRDMKPILHATILPILFASFSETVLMQCSGVAHLFVMFAGLSLGEWLELRRTNKITVPLDSLNDPAFSRA
ncbi:MAG: O-antigen ligase family protein [Gammaproteobacteria bacterium]